MRFAYVFVTSIYRRMQCLKRKPLRKPMQSRMRKTFQNAYLIIDVRFPSEIHACIKKCMRMSDAIERVDLIKLYFFDFS